MKLLEIFTHHLNEYSDQYLGFCTSVEYKYVMWIANNNNNDNYFIDDVSGENYQQCLIKLILQSYDLPQDWISYLCENFKQTEEELLNGILEFGTDVFEENIFNHYHYQAIGPFIEISFFKVISY